MGDGSNGPHVAGNVTRDPRFLRALLQHIVVNTDIGRLTAEVDGKKVVIEEVGSVERPTPIAGEKAKDIASDAIKRCAMRLGLGLHLWSQENYVLHQILAKKEGEQE